MSHYLPIYCGFATSLSELTNISVSPTSACFVCCRVLFIPFSLTINHRKEEMPDMPSYPPVSEGASAAVRRQLRWTGDGCVRSPLLTPARTTRTPEQAVTPQRAQLWIIRVHFNKKNKTTTATITASGCVLSVGTRLKGTILLILFGKPRDIHACGQIT